MCLLISIYFWFQLKLLIFFCYHLLPSTFLFLSSCRISSKIRQNKLRSIKSLQFILRDLCSNTSFTWSWCIYLDFCVCASLKEEEGEKEKRNKTTAVFCIDSLNRQQTIRKQKKKRKRIRNKTENKMLLLVVLTVCCDVAAKIECKTISCSQKHTQTLTLAEHSIARQALSSLLALLSCRCCALCYIYFLAISWIICPEFLRRTFHFSAVLFTFAQLFF